MCYFKLKYKSNILSIFLIILSFLVLVIYISFFDGIANVLNIFSNCNRFWFLVGFFVMFSYWFLEYYILNRSLKIFNSKLNFSNGIKNCMLGQFFNNITPSATGGQPFQVFYMSKFCKINSFNAVGALLLKFLSFEIALTLLCSFVIFFKFNYFANKIQGFVVLIIMGFLLNTIIAIILILVGVNKKFTSFLIDFFILLLKKLRIFKKSEEKLKEFKNEIEIFNETVLRAFKNKKEFLIMIFFSLLQILLFYIVNVVIVFVFKMNLTLNLILNIICGAACVQMSSTFVPLPGAVGGAEFLFFVIYDGIFSAKYMTSALLLWRIYTFYLPIIIGLIFSRGLLSSNSELKKSD